MILQDSNKWLDATPSSHNELYKENMTFFHHETSLEYQFKKHFSNRMKNRIQWNEDNSCHSKKWNLLISTKISISTWKLPLYFERESFHFRNTILWRITQILTKEANRSFLIPHNTSLGMLIFRSKNRILEISNESSYISFLSLRISLSQVLSANSENNRWCIQLISLVREKNCEEDRTLAITEFYESKYYLLDSTIVSDVISNGYQIWKYQT